MSVEVKNAVIRGTHLGEEGHGIMTCYLRLAYGEHGGQSFGGYGFDNIETNFGIEFIKSILKVVGVDNWESLIGKHIRVKADMSRIYAIGNIIKDDWFEPGKEE